MGSCLSAPQGQQPAISRGQADGRDATTSTSARRQHRQRERTSLERRNHEARDQLIAARGEAPKYRRHGSWIANPPVTRKQLEHTRTAFWETADTFGGRKDVWDILRAAVNCTDIESASTMLTGADIRLLGNGDLINGCYDPTGFFYKIPEECLSDPTNLILEDSSTKSFDAQSTSIVEEFPEAQLIEMRVRLSHNSQDLILRVALQEKISSVATKIQAAAGVTRLKLMILGRMLKDDGMQTLKDAGWTPGLIVQALVTQV